MTKAELTAFTKRHSEATSKGKKGKELSEKNKIALRGIKRSAATRQRMSLAKIGKPSSRKGTKLSNTTKQRMSESKKGKPWSVARRVAHESRSK